VALTIHARLPSILSRTGGPVAMLSVLLMAAACSGSAGKPDLRLTIVLAEQEPRYVQRAAQDVSSEWEARFRQTTKVETSLEKALQMGGQLVVAGELGKQFLGSPSSRDQSVADLGDEGYIIKSADISSRKGVVVVGQHPRGTNYGLLDLASRLAAMPENGLSAFNVREKPRYPLRGMYAHQHWQYKYPYALRSWKLEDWKRYIDILAQFRVNLFQIWTMVGIIPDPPSPEDWEYLKKYDEIIRYAREERGMVQVWPGECANNIATSAHHMPIENREYFVVEELRDPGEPKQFREIMANRANMYEATPRGDGYWIIDADPGKWVGSPPSEFVDLFIGNRKLIEQYNKKPEQTKLIYWMWWGWGVEFAARSEKNIREAVKDLEQRLKGPFWNTVSNETHLKIASDFNRIDRSVYFPYGAIEGEPSFPLTKISFDLIKERFRLIAGYPEIAGVMGNAQTPLVQFPNIHFFSALCWNPENANRPAKEALLDLSRRIYPDSAEMIAEGWYQLSLNEPASCRSSAEALERQLAQKRLGRPGVVGKYLFPNGETLIQDLIPTLRMHAFALDALRQLGNAPPEPSSLAEAISGYLSQGAILQQNNGFHVAPKRDGSDWLPNFAWYLSGPDYDAIRKTWNESTALSTDTRNRIVADVTARMQQTRYDQKVYQRMIDFLLKRPPVRRMH
jgi:hypothetical protein